MTEMASHGRVVAASMVLLAAACGISAVGQRIDSDPSNDPDAGSSSSGMTSGSSSSGGANEGGPADAGVDGQVDAALDAPIDVVVGCPAACNGGCDGGCIINGGQDPTCPPGVARCEVACAQQNDCDTVTCGDAGICRVTCSGNSVCNSDTINCGTSACQIRCVGQDACNSTTIDAEFAASLCLFCNGSPGCNSLTCSPAITCTRQYTGTGNNVGGCVMCTAGTCP